MTLRRLSLGLGILLFLAGAAIMGIGLFSYFGAGTGAEEPSPYLTWGDTAEGIYDWTLPPEPSPEAPVPAPPPPPAVTASYRLLIESIGVDAPVQTFGLDGDGAPEVPLNGVEVAWYDFSAVPGTGSNAVLAAHVNWNRAPAVFSRLKDVRAGDLVRLLADDGSELVYEVSDNFLVDPDDPSSLQVMAPTPTDTLTLITCGGTWLPNPSERFGGEYTNRVIVRATLVSVNAAGGPEGGNAGG